MRIYTLILFLAGLASCKTINHVADIQNTNIQLDSTVQFDSAITEMIQPYKIELDKEMNEVIGIAGEDLVKGKLNSSMGNFFSDLLHIQAEKYTDHDIAFAINNYGGLRIPSIPRGEITKGKIFELMPFDNTMVILEMPGPSVVALCNRIAEYGGWPVSFGLTMDIVESKASNILVNGEALDLSKTYHVVMTDYVANGGDKCHFLKDLVQDNTGLFIREVFIEGIEEWSEKCQELVHNSEVRIHKK